MELSQNIGKYFELDIIDTPEGPGHSGYFKLVTGAWFLNHKVFYDYAEPNFTFDEALALSKNFSVHNDTPGRLKFYFKESESSKT